ncbi:MAG TPA: hypothetical protein VHU23_01045 [Rhizomicrobium sp.]|jgi:hypothetical protein|nr:hypothetical protein [Rhizomicrobium sp.]
MSRAESPLAQMRRRLAAYQRLAASPTLEKWDRPIARELIARQRALILYVENVQPRRSAEVRD